MVESEEIFNMELGARIQARRKLLGYNAKDLSQQLGISQQQLYKYESGVDRVSAMRLCEIAQYLGVPISYFFEEMPWAEDSQKTAEQQHIPAQVLDDKETRDLLKHYISIGDTRTRLAFVDVIKSVSKYITKTTGKKFMPKY